MPDNSATLVGNLVDDPELRFTQSGVPVCSFRLAVSAWRGKDNEKATTYWNVTAWRELGENFAECGAGKGDRVFVVGELTQRSYENKDGVTVWTTEVTAEEAGISERFKRKSGGSRPQANTPPPPADDDVPF